MIVADTSALVSLATRDVLELMLDEFEVHTTATVIDELETTSEYDDVHGNAARTALQRRSHLTVHRVGEQGFSSSRIDDGEGRCAVLARELDADFLLTDDLRALPELEAVVDARIAISPIVLKSLVNRGVIDAAEAERRVEMVAETRDWLGAPIYRRARRLFEDA